MLWQGKANPIGNYVSESLPIFFGECEISEMLGKMPTSDFKMAGFQKQALGYSKHAKSDCVSVSISIL